MSQNVRIEPATSADLSQLFGVADLPEWPAQGGARRATHSACTVQAERAVEFYNPFGIDESALPTATSRRLPESGQASRQRLKRA